MALSVPAKAFLRQLARLDGRDRDAVYRAYREAFKLEGDKASNRAVAGRVARLRGSFEAFEFMQAETCRAEHAQAAAAVQADQALFNRDKALAEMEQATIEAVTEKLRDPETNARGISDLGGTAVKVLARTKQGRFDAAAERQKAALLRQLKGAKKQRVQAREGDSTTPEQPPIIAPGAGLGTA